MGSQPDSQEVRRLFHAVIDLGGLGTVESLFARNAQQQRVASTSQRAGAGQERVSDPTAPAVEPIREDGDPHPGPTSALSRFSARGAGGAALSSDYGVSGRIADMRGANRPIASSQSATRRSSFLSKCR